MFSIIKSTLYRNFTNAIGRNINQRIIVFESDDWGSIRMPSYNVYNKLKAHGVHVDRTPYERFDCLESERDILNLFDVLKKHKDANGNYPIITANIVVSNPNFERIKSSYFSEYVSEIFLDTYERYYANKTNMTNIWKNGICEHLLMPQFHGREHYRIDDWMKSLRNGTNKDRNLFDMGIVSLSKIIGEDYGSGYYLKVLNSKSTIDIEKDNEKLLQGMNMFDRIFGFRSKTFIAPCYTWSPLHEKALFAGGITHIQGLTMQNVPFSRHKFHYSGMKNQYGQKYLTRNAFFEPVSDSNAVYNCLKRISNAFMWKQPAIICTHRINFSGEIFESNRKTNIEQLDTLLSEITKRWPDVIFMSSDQLSNII